MSNDKAATASPASLGTSVGILRLTFAVENNHYQDQSASALQFLSALDPRPRRPTMSARCEPLWSMVGMMPSALEASFQVHSLRSSRRVRVLNLKPLGMDLDEAGQFGNSHNHMCKSTP